MRIHVNVDDDLLDRLDERVGARGRSAFIVSALARALEDEHRWEQIEAGIGAITDGGHAWDHDAAGWVRGGRRSDSRRVG